MPLLDSYNIERHAVAEHNVALSWEIWKDMRQAWRITGAALGVRYESGAVLPDGTELPQVATPITDYVPSARPGSRAPHQWLNIEGRRLSTIDLFNGPFVLLSMTPAWCEAARQVATRLGVPLVAQIITADEWARSYAVGREGAVLVRPDGFVAWRTNGPSTNEMAVLEEVLGRVLALHPIVDSAI
jgi:hypothetical protein